MLNLSNLQSEVFSVHNAGVWVLFKVLISKDTSLVSYSLGGFDMVTTDHSNINVASLLDGINHALNILSKWILKSKSSQESELNVSVIKGLLELFAGGLELLGPLLKIHFEVSEGDDSEGLGGHGVDFSSDFLTKVWTKLNDTS